MSNLCTRLSSGLGKGRAADLRFIESVGRTISQYANRSKILGQINNLGRPDQQFLETWIMNDKLLGYFLLGDLVKHCYFFTNLMLTYVDIGPIYPWRIAQFAVTVMIRHHLFARWLPRVCCLSPLQYLQLPKDCDWEIHCSHQNGRSAGTSVVFQWRSERWKEVSWFISVGTILLGAVGWVWLWVQWYEMQ